MSIRNPLAWLKEQIPGDAYDTITLRVKDGVNGRKVHYIDSFGKHKRHSYETVIDWLERSQIYIWPYAEAEHVDDDVRKIAITLQVDCAAVSALFISGEDSMGYNLAGEVAKTLSALSDHVYLNTKGTIFLTIPKR